MTLALLGGTPVRTRPFPAWPVFDRGDEDRLLRALRSGQWGRVQGTEVAEFEERFGALHGCRYAVAVASGTVALRIALLAATIGAEDEVIVPPYTFVSTATAVVEANATPVFADVDVQTFNIDPRAVEAALTPRTRAIIPVHFGGGTADLDPLLRIAEREGLVLIEDAAHAHGAAFRGRPAGSIGHLGVFSFQSSKNLTAGEGGIIVTNDESLADACRSIQNCGRASNGPWYEHHVMGGNYRLGEFQGAVLNAQLGRLDEQTRVRDANGRYLAAQLGQLPGLHPQARRADCTRHSYHLFLLRIVPEEFGATRGAVLEALRAEGIPCSGGYPLSLPQQPVFRRKAFGPYLSHAAARLDYAAVRCPASDLLCTEQAVWLEGRLLLGSVEDMDDIVRAFEKVYRHRDALPPAPN